MSAKQNYLYPAIVVFGLAGILAGSPSLAHGGGGGMGATMGGGAGMNGNFGDQSSTHIGSQSMANTNGPNAMDRDFGTAHAQEQTSAQGLAHSEALSKNGADTDSDKDNTPSSSTTSTSSATNTDTDNSKDDMASGSTPSTTSDDTKTDKSDAATSSPQ